MRSISRGEAAYPDTGSFLNPHGDVQIGSGYR